MSRIYIACLASYNNGVHHGEWVELYYGPDHVEEEIGRILRESKYPNVMVDCPQCAGDGCPQCGGTGQVASAEEWAAHDYDGVAGEWGESPNLADLCEFVEACAEHGEAYALFCDMGRGIEVSDFQEAYQGCYKSELDWVYEYVDSTGMLDGMEALANYFDYEAYLRDAKSDVTFEEGDDGIHVFYSY